MSNIKSLKKIVQNNKDKKEKKPEVYLYPRVKEEEMYMKKMAGKGKKKKK